MKKILAVLLLINLSLLAFILFYQHIIERTYLSIEHIKHFYSSADNKQLSLNTLVLGDSTVAFGIQPLLFNNSLSLALPSSTNISVFLELSRFLQFTKPPKCIVYSTSYISEHYYNGFLGKHMSAQLYDWNELIKLYKQSELDKINPSLTSNKFSYFLRIFYLKYLDFTAYTQIKIKRYLLPSLNESKKFEKNRLTVINQKGFLPSKSDKHPFVSSRQQYLFEPFKTDQSDDQYFMNILNLAKIQNIKFFYVSMPILNIGNDERVSKFIEKHDTHILKLIKNFNNVEFIKLNFKSEKGDYFDMNHLNTKGSRNFSLQLSERINNECNN